MLHHFKAIGTAALASLIGNHNMIVVVQTMHSRVDILLTTHRQ